MKSEIFVFCNILLDQDYLFLILQETAVSIQKNQPPPPPFSSLSSLSPHLPPCLLREI
jgi:hypothetical protein